MESGERVLAVITLPDFEKGHNLVMATRRGIIEAPIEQFERVRSTGIQAINVEDDALAQVAVSSGSDDIVLATRLGNIARFNERNVQAMGRDAAGVIGIRLAKQGDQLVGMEVIPSPEASILVLTDTGYGKRVPLSEFMTRKTAPTRVSLIRLEGAKTGNVAAVRIVEETDEELLLISAAGQVVRTDVMTVSRQLAGARGRHRHASRRATRWPASRCSRPGWRSSVARGRMRRTGRVPTVRRVTGPPRDGTTAGGQPRELLRNGSRRSGARHAGPVRGQREPRARAQDRPLPGRDAGCRGRVRQREHLRQDRMDNVREHDVYLIQPTCSPVQKSSWSC